MTTIATTYQFNPALLLYLNPELSVQQNIVTIEDAIVYQASPSFDNTLWYTLDPIPPNFDELVFIGDNKSSIDCASLNSNIKAAMILDGMDLGEVERGGRYVSSIYRAVYNRGVNTFQFNFPGDPTTYTYNQNNLVVGDWVKLLKDNAEPHFGYVAECIDNQTFTLCNVNYAFNDPSAAWLCIGIKMYDPLRLARINYLRQFASLPQPPTLNMVNIDPDFNYELYQMLYPDARLLDRETAFLDYTNRLNNNEFRVKNEQDIKRDNLQLPYEFEYLNVNKALQLDFTQATGRIEWCGLNLSYVTANGVRRATEVPPFFDGLITERAIKTYIDRSFLEVAVFNEVIVNGKATFKGNVYLDGDKTFVKQAIMSNATVCNDMYVWGTMNMKGPAKHDNTVTFNQPTYFGSIATFEGQKLLVNSPMDVNSNSFFNKLATFCNGALFRNNATFECDTKFSNNVTTLSNVYHKGMVHFSNVAVFTSNITVCNMLGCNVYINNLGGMQANLCNIDSRQIYVKYLAAEAYVSSNIACSNIFAEKGAAWSWDMKDMTASNGFVNKIVSSNAEVYVLTGHDNAGFSSNVDIGCNLMVGGDMECHGTIYGANIGIADMLSLEPPEVSTLQSMNIDNLAVNETLHVAGMVTIGNQHTLTQTMLHVDGIIEAYNFDVTSDLRIKENIEYNIDKKEKESGLDGPLSIVDRLDMIKPCSYNYKNKLNKRRRFGFVAQDVEALFPEVITHASDYKIPINKVAHWSGKGLAFVLEDHGFDVGDKIEVWGLGGSKNLFFLKIAEVPNQDMFIVNKLVPFQELNIVNLVYDDLRMIDYPQLTALLFLYIQDLKNQVDTLKTLTPRPSQ